MKELIIKQLQTSLKLIEFLVDHPVAAEGVTDRDFETLSVCMGYTAEAIQSLGGDING